MNPTPPPSSPRPPRLPDDLGLHSGLIGPQGKSGSLLAWCFGLIVTLASAALVLSLLLRGSGFSEKGEKLVRTLFVDNDSTRAAMVQERNQIIARQRRLESAPAPTQATQTTQATQARDDSSFINNVLEPESSADPSSDPVPAAAAAATEVSHGSGHTRCIDIDVQNPLELRSAAILITGSKSRVGEVDRCVSPTLLIEADCKTGFAGTTTIDCLRTLPKSGGRFIGCREGRCVKHEMSAAAPQTKGASALETRDPPAEPEESATTPSAGTPAKRVSQAAPDPAPIHIRRCRETDGGGKINRAGRVVVTTTAGRRFGRKDHCLDDHQIVEFYCEDHKLYQKTFDCLDPSFASYKFNGCRDGACRK